MRIADTLKLSFSILRANKVRTFLTSLGIIIGIASIIIIMSVGAGAQSLITNQLTSMGSNLIGIMPGAAEKDGPPASVMGIVVTSLKYEDALQIKRQVEYVKAISAYNSGVASVSYQNSKVNANYYGVMAGYFDVENIEMDLGRFLTEEEEKNNAKVVVLGSQLREELFGDIDPIGKKIKIKRETFDVIGVTKKRGVVGFQNQDNIALIPISTAQNSLLGVNYVNFIRLKIENSENIDESKEEIRWILRERHDIDSGQADDFTISDPKEAIDALLTITNALKFFLAAIAGISLVVGGVGVMNIMLASINERIREIGLRKSVGAKNGDLLSQFLTESIVITIIGGVIGVSLGIGFSFLISVIANFLGYNWEFVITLSSVIIAIVVSLFIGFIFGIYPATRASKLDPIEALRYE